MIHNKHEDWIGKENNKKVLVIDTTEDFEHCEERIEEIVEKICKFIQSE